MTARAAGDNSVFSDLAMEDFCVVPDRGDMIEKLQLGFVADDVVTASGTADSSRRATRPVVPVKKLPRAVETHALGQLIRVACVFIDPLVVVTNRVIRRTGQDAGKQNGQCQTVRGLGFIACDALLRH